MNPIFSIIIPAKNVALFIHEALDSVLSQTFQDFEVIVIDDSSCDATVGVVKDYQKQFKPAQLQLLSCPPDHIPGPGAVRNVGLRASKGKIIAFLDADDIWIPEHLEYAHKAFEQYPEAVAYYALGQRFDAHTKEWLGTIGWGPNVKSGLFEAFQLIIQDDPVPHSTGCIRRDIAEAIRGFEERLLTAQDWWFWICAAKKGCFVFNPQIEIFYRVDKKSHTGGGDGVNPMLSGPCFADVASHSNVLTKKEYQPLCNLVMDRTSRRLQNYVRTIRLDVLGKVWHTMQNCPHSERRIWFQVWGMVAKGLMRRAIRSIVVRIGLLAPERQFK